MRVCFGRLVSKHWILVLLSQIFSQETQTIADYENMNLAGKARGGLKAG